MNVKGFILEDDQGREVVMVCEQPCVRSAKTFALRGWQRRRLVPLQYTQQERREIVAEVLLTLNDLFTSLPRFGGVMDDGSFENGDSGDAGGRAATGVAGEHRLN